MSTAAAPVAKDDGKITCELDGARVHVIQAYLKESHPEWTVERYRAAYPDAPLLSPAAAKRLAEKKAQAEEAAVTGHIERLPLAKVFETGDVPATKNKRNEPILIAVYKGHQPEALALVPEIDRNYVFNLELVKTALMGLEMRMNVYFWGYHGSGKTTLFEQACARTKRPFMRVQHTANTEEAHIIGQYVVQAVKRASKDAAGNDIEVLSTETVFQPGPLTIAMLNGYVYCADEYDFALPSVLALYQPILEGKPLYIKDAPPEMRMIKPHPDFRFVATGNTNGGGDETGLYQGTQIQNAANYSRMHIVEEVPYMEASIETAIVQSQASLKKADAEKLVKFANDIREAFKGGRIGMTISTRELITAGRLAAVRGSDYEAGLRQGYMNRMSRIDREAASQLAQRYFG
ncbi:AAA family ATPase [Methylorubrum extorquens]|uniref:AAA family ATPase n=1 Tax=Methylorubrum extorquens TaxID=408 RepID=UPI0020A0BAEB|nr:MoxR family ATPase [Methylorubrum extorquens]MCP1540017.1 cobaltochelatase CobS [Methylorubrum extorquens]